jgi:nicotinamide-nucleotide amidase
MPPVFPAKLAELAAAVLTTCEAVGLHVVTAESCTGGLVAGCLTEIAGSSRVVERGFVTYSNEAKTELLDVPAELIAQHGAVSAEVAEAMTVGALSHSRADLAVAVTGVAGPDGGTPAKPVGLVYVASARRGRAVRHEHHLFAGDRAAVRLASVERALYLLRDAALP